MQKSRYKKYKLKKQKSLKANRLLNIIILLTVVISFLILIFGFWKIQTLKKFAYVNNNDGNVEIIFIDALRDKYIKSLINKDFIVQSSRNYGQYEIGKLWILGQKDGTKGKLITETVTKNFSIPIYLWKDGKSSNLNLFQKIKSVLVYNKLTEYDYTFKTINTPDSFLVNFIDSKTELSYPKLELVDLTGSNHLAEKLANILAIYGIKITSYSKGYDKGLDCEVGGIDKDLVEIASKIFSCQKKLDDGGVDLKIRIGKIFAERF